MPKPRLVPKRTAGQGDADMAHPLYSGRWLRKAWQISAENYGYVILERKTFDPNPSVTRVTLPMGMDAVYNVPERYVSAQYTLAHFDPDGTFRKRDNPIVMSVGDTLQITTKLEIV